MSTQYLIVRVGELFQELARELKLALRDLLTALEKREYMARVRADFSHYA
jgi:hypothetical protein